MQYRLDPEMISTPGSARAVEVQPEVVVISLDRQASRLVPVKVDVQGVPPAGFEMEMAAADPVAVQVTGPRTMVDQLDQIRTAPVMLDGKRGTFRERVELVPPENNWVAAMEPTRVNARVTIRERAETREFRDVPIRALIRPLNDHLLVTFNPMSASVIVRGVSGSLKKVNATDIQLYVNCEGIKPGARYEMPVRAMLPDGVSIAEIVPASVAVSTLTQ